MSVHNYENPDGSHAYAMDGETFEEFIKLLQEMTDSEIPFMPQSWAMIARALGVSQTTIYKWRQSKEARALSAEGIKLGLRNMLHSGRKDWKMWQEYLKLMGVQPEKQIAVDDNGEVITGITVNIVNPRSNNEPNNALDERTPEDSGSSEGEEDNP